MNADNINDQQVESAELKIATFNLFNYLAPPGAFYDFDRIYTQVQWHKKQRWLSNYLATVQPDIIAFQEVFSIDSLAKLTEQAGYPYFAVVDQPQVTDDFIYREPVVALASKFPIEQVSSVKVSVELAKAIGLNEAFTFSRKMLRATVNIPQLGPTDCYVVHFKSKRSMLEHNMQNKDFSNFSKEKHFSESLKAQIIGGWGSSIQRGSEAALLLAEIIERRAETNWPMILMGDFNTCLSDGVLQHLVSDDVRFADELDQESFKNKYRLVDAWNLYIEQFPEAAFERTPTHYYGAKGSVLDYILLSSEFNAHNDKSFCSVANYEVADKHLLNADYEEDDLSTDHGVVSITLTMRS